ncbi:MAG: hypothetical protein ACU0CI_10340 [Shimia sp.]
MTEADLILLICSYFFKGEKEQRINFDVGVASSHIRTDCETDSLVIEVGKDRHSSLDSVQQALFAHLQTGKQPVVFIVDTDGKIGSVEYRIQTVAKHVGVTYQRMSADFLQRHAMTSYLRERPRPDAVTGSLPNREDLAALTQ